MTQSSPAFWVILCWPVPRIVDELEEATSFHEDPHFSYSQIRTFELCPRKWALSYLGDYERKPSEYAQYGQLTHDHLDEWFKNRTLPPENGPGWTARAILAELPTPQTPNLYSEVPIEFWIGPHRFIGYIDLLILDDIDPPFVSDHKTTGNFKWALQEDMMPDDIQVALYSYAIMYLTGNYSVKCQWTYGLRVSGNTVGSKPALPIKRLIEAEDIEPRLLKIHQSADQMQAIIDANTPPMEVPYFAAGCEAFPPGCQFKELCSLTPQEMMRSIMAQAATEETRDDQAKTFREKLAARKRKQQEARGDDAGVNPEEEPPKVPPKDKETEPATQSTVETETKETPKETKETPKETKPVVKLTKPAAKPVVSTSKPAAKPAAKSTPIEQDIPIGGTAPLWLVDLCMKYYRQGVQDGLEIAARGVGIG